MFRKTKKSLLSILLTIVMVFTLVPATAFADASESKRVYFSGIHSSVSYIKYRTDTDASQVDEDGDGSTDYWFLEEGTTGCEVKVVAEDGYELTDVSVKSSSDPAVQSSTFDQRLTDYDIRSNSDDTTYWLTFDTLESNIQINVSEESTTPDKTVTTVDITASGYTDTVFERDTITVYADLGDSSINEGSMLFKLPDGDQKIIPVLDGKAEVVWTVPSSLVGKSAKFNAVYLGSENYSQSGNELDLGAIGSKTIAKTSDSEILANGNGNASLMAKIGYTLSLSDNAVINTSGSNLTFGSDYTVTWYESRGGEFTKVGTDETCDVTPDNTSYVYKAVVEPIGDYDAGTFELVVGCGTQYRPELRIQNISSEFEGQDVIIKADLTGVNGEKVIDIAGGTVIFYTADGSGDKVAKLGEASVVDSQAEITFNNLPAGDYAIIAYYTGVEGVYDSVKSYEPKALTINSAALPDSTWELTAKDEDGNDIVISDGMVPLDTYTLSLATSDAAADLAYGEDYEIVWKMSLDNGLTWSIIDSSNYEDDGSIVVTPETNATQYALYVMPIGDYTKPENGKPVDRITCDDNVAEVTIDLTVSEATPYEQELIGFTAVAYTSATTKDIDGDEIDVYTPVIGGTITLKEGTETIGEYAVDAAGMVRVTIPAPAYGSTVTYKAIYSGTSTFGAAKDTVDVTSKSAGIYADGEGELNRAKLNVYDVSGNPVIGNEITQGNAYILKVENVKSVEGTVLVYGTDYLVEWYADWSGNGNYEPLASGTDVLEITAENVAISYKAVVVPIGHYTKPAQGIELFVGNTGDKYDVVTAINVAETFVPAAEKVPNAGLGELLSGSHYGDDVKITAMVDGSTALEVPTGFVRFSYDLGGETTVLGTVELVDTGETAYTSKAEILTEELPAGVIDIKAEYLGSNVFYGVNDEEHIDVASDIRADYKVWTITIDDSSVVIQAYPMLEGGVPSVTPVDLNTELTASKTYLLKLSDVYTTDGEKLDADEFTTQWFSRDEQTTEWLDITTDSSMTSVFVTPLSLNYGFKAVVTTTDKFYNDVHSGLADSATSNLISSDLRGSVVNVTIDPDVSAYQANDVTIHAKVLPADGTGTPTGTVAFYYADAADSENWTLIAYKTAADSSKIAIDPVTNIAEIITNSLPVKADGTARNLYIKAVYSGDVNYEGQTGYYGSVTPSPYTIKSSVIDRSKVQITSPGTPADGTKTYLTLGPIVTLDGEVLTYNVDYTIEWQKRPTASADINSWETIPEGTSSQIEINTEEDVQYRAKVTAVETSVKAKASYINFNTNQGEAVTSPAQGTRENYSNIINVTKADAVIYTNIVPASSGALDGNNVVINVNVYGGETTPVGEVAVTVTDENGDKVFESTDNAVSGWNSFTWENAPAGVYNVETKYTSNNEYVAETINEEYVVRFTDHTLSINKSSVTYDGEEHVFTANNATVNGISDEKLDLKAMAQADVVYTYYYHNNDGSKTIVEAPVKAGTYTVNAWLPESKYWTETEATTEFTIAKRQLSINEIVALDKIYDGTNGLDILKVEIPYASLGANGVPSGNTGIVEGDSVYAVITNGTLNSADAGSRTYTVNGVALYGPGADNYFMNSGYTQNVEVLRSQLEGEIASGIVLAPGQKITSSQIKLISQNGANYTSGYTVSYYLHTGEQVVKVSNTNTVGLYTVVVTGGANYKGGASADVYVAKTGQSAGAFSNTVYSSSIIHVGNTEVEFGTANATGVNATASNGAGITEVRYYANAADIMGTTIAPTNAGRYIFKVTSSTGDYVYGLYTVHKSSATTIPYNVSNSVYGGEYTVNGGAAEYVSYTGGRLTGIDYIKPLNAGSYLVTYHYPESDNYVAYTTQDEFTISPKTMVITADRKYAELYTTAPSLKVTYSAADGDNSDTNGFEYLDSSMNALIVQPTIIVGIADSENLDLNDSGLYDIIPSGSVAYNYVFNYESQNMAKITTCPEEALEIVGIPQGTIQYGDEFRVGAYGCKVGARHNDSSELTWTADGAAEVDQLGNVTITGVGEFSITVTKGTGAYAISTTYEGVAEKKLVDILIDDVDRAYDSSDKYGDDAYDFAVLEQGDNLSKADCNVSGEPETNSGNYVVTAEIDHELYQGVGTGLLSIHKVNAFVHARSITKNYGDDLGGRFDGCGESGKANVDDKLLDPAGFTAANILTRTDVGSYKTFAGGGTEQYKNYNIGYKTSSYTVNRKAMTFNTAVREGTNLESSAATLKNAAFNMGTSARMYGEYNRILDFKANLVDLDTFADILSGSIIAEYDKTIKSDANVACNTTNSYLPDRNTPYYVEGVLGSLIDRNYDITMHNAISNISQRPITVTITEPFSVDVGTMWKDAYTYTTVTTAKYSNEGGLAQHTTYTDPNYIYDTVSTLKLMPLVDSGENGAVITGEYIFRVNNMNYWAGNTNTEQVFDSTTDDNHTVHINVENISLSAVIYDKTTTSFKVKITKDNVALSNIEGIQYTVTNTKTNVVEAAGTLQVTSNGYYLASYNKLSGSDYIIRFAKDGYNFNYSN